MSKNLAIPILMTDSMLELINKFLPESKTPMWLLVEHRCPVCKKAVTDWQEIEFMDFNGSCGTCDHVKGDLG